jgi:acyl-CoA hydrolase
MANEARPVSRSRVEMTELVLPQFTNARGHLFGGQLVSWMDICGAVAAQRHAAAYVVTASIDAVHFMEPVLEGQTVVLRGQVNAAFRSSMECGVSVWTEDPLTSRRRRVGKAYSTFVALDDKGRPKPVPELTLETDEDRRRSRQAAERRRQRLAIRKTYGSMRPPTGEDESGSSQ